jgi:hypothetical protein
MSDDKPTASKPAAPTIIFKGGTNTSSLDREIAVEMEDINKRRQEADEERRRAVILSNPADASEEGFKVATQQAAMIEDGGVMLENRLASANDAAEVIIEYRSKDGTLTQFLQADVRVSEQGMMLILLCPRCVRRGRPQTMSQFHVRDDNRKWYLDEKLKGQVWADPDSNEPHVIAGKVEMPELGRCPHPNCDFKFRITSTNHENPLCSLFVSS